MKQEKDTVLSIKMSKAELNEITAAAQAHHETRSGYSRRILLESAKNPIYTGKDVMGILWGIGNDLQSFSADNSEESILKINSKGAAICRILSLK